jgi:hypothetical protein
LDERPVEILTIEQCASLLGAAESAGALSALSRAGEA